MSERIRRGVPADATAIAAIYDPIVAGTAISFEDEPPGTEEMRRRIDAAGDRYPWMVFERDSRVLGYVYASPHRSRSAYRWSVDVSVYVATQSQRQGIAKRLYLALFAALASQGYCSAFAGVALPNDASLRLHERVGFTTVGTYHRVGFKFGRWHDVRWLERRLRDEAFPSEPGPYLE